ncbi:thiamine diphosphokinase [Bifidobacterium cebidarum]|uniref:Thiamine diphosphokinase n=1 Tax=Bifidobacterium cebidarum TaxID=2650773 RepID=A0A6I1GN72_9BIFI|nr:thiamine diphosphokinase [Bifidobacterium cebidarum]KAB7787887.1 thiamine pyrophosphokinase [Bifidobacterium cebidarum]
MTTKVCAIFGAGEYYGDPDPALIPSDAYVVAADGGLDHTRALGITPNVVVGDFDSLEGARPAAADGLRTVVLPPLKDDPDMLSALKIGWAAGCREFRIWGGLGGRVDHTLSNIQLMALLAQHGASGYLFGDGTVVTAICDGSLSFAAHPVPEAGHMVSVFSLSDVSLDVNEPGLKYELEHGTLTNTVVQGVSNEFRDNKPASISVGSGTLIVTFPAEVALPNVRLAHEFNGGIGELDTEVSALLAH